MVLHRKFRAVIHQIVDLRINYRDVDEARNSGALGRVDHELSDRSFLVLQPRTHVDNRVHVYHGASEGLAIEKITRLDVLYPALFEESNIQGSTIGTNDSLAGLQRLEHVPLRAARGTGE